MSFWEEQMAHEPTRLYYEKLKYVIEQYEETLSFSQDFKDVLEIGLDVGISARTFLEFDFIKLTSIDGGNVEGGIKNIEELNTGRWTFHHQWSDDYFKECKRKFDIIYIDGDHSYEQTKKDINNAWKFIKPDGLLIGHDYLHKGNFTVNPDYGVHKAFREFIIENNVEAHVYPPEPGLIVIRK